MSNLLILIVRTHVPDDFYKLNDELAFFANYSNARTIGTSSVSRENEYLNIVYCITDRPNTILNVFIEKIDSVIDTKDIELGYGISRFKELVEMNRKIKDLDFFLSHTEKKVENWPLPYPNCAFIIDVSGKELP